MLAAPTNQVADPPSPSRDDIRAIRTLFYDMQVLIAKFDRDPRTLHEVLKSLRTKLSAIESLAWDDVPGETVDLNEVF